MANNTADSTTDSAADSKPSRQTTDFGYQTVDAKEKGGLVGEVFQSVAMKYDLMNDLMSFGAHRIWKRFAVSMSGLRRGNSVLDVAGGSGDLAQQFAKQVGDEGVVMLSDINAAMLQQGRDRMIDAGRVGNIIYALTDAEKLCFADDSFHCVSIAFGLRNVTHKQHALASMYRVLRPGGRVLVLEFSKPLVPLLAKVYDAYSFRVIPKLGGLIADDEVSYQYLVESIRRHPDQSTLKAMMNDAGFEDVRIHNLSGGIVALHIGFKY